MPARLRRGVRGGGLKGDVKGLKPLLEGAELVKCEDEVLEAIEERFISFVADVKGGCGVFRQNWDA